MATREQAVKLLEMFKDLRPVSIFKDIQGVNEGTKFVLAYLDENNHEVYASSLSEVMNISRARMSVLLDKLIQKQLIEKTVSVTDARKEVIYLTPLGREQVKQKKAELENKVMKLIDEMGIKKLVEFAKIAKQIKAIVME